VSPGRAASSSFGGFLNMLARSSFVAARDGEPPVASRGGVSEAADTV